MRFFSKEGFRILFTTHEEREMSPSRPQVAFSVTGPLVLGLSILIVLLSMTSILNPALLMYLMGCLSLYYLSAGTGLLSSLFQLKGEGLEWSSLTGTDEDRDLKRKLIFTKAISKMLFGLGNLALMLLSLMEIIPSFVAFPFYGVLGLSYMISGGFQLTEAWSVFKQLRQQPTFSWKAFALEFLPNALVGLSYMAVGTLFIGAAVLGVLGLAGVAAFPVGFIFAMAVASVALLASRLIFESMTAKLEKRVVHYGRLTETDNLEGHPGPVVRHIDRRSPVPMNTNEDIIDVSGSSMLGSIFSSGSKPTHRAAASTSTSTLGAGASR